MSSLLDLTDPNIIEGLLNRSIKPHELSLLSTCAGLPNGHTRESVKNSAIDLLNKVSQYKAGGDLDFKIYQAGMDDSLPYIRLHGGDPNSANEFEKWPGFATMGFDPKDQTDVLAAGGSDGYQDAFAKDIKFKNRDQMMMNIKPTTGWHRSTRTSFGQKTRKGAVPNKYRMVIYHKKDFKIDNGGPPMLGTNEARATYLRELRKRKRDAEDA